MAELKTFLFTDIVGSVELKRAMPGHSDTERDQAFIERILTPHRARIEQKLETLGGRVVSTAGDGHFLVFTDTVLAARWAVGIQQSHRDEPINTPSGRPVAVRMSMHLGIPQIDPRDENNFVGKTVDYAARLNDFATGEQILVSRSVVAILEDAGMDGVSFHRHGSHDLKGIGQIEIYELVYDASGPRKMRPQPREQEMRQWTVLPATVGLTEFYATGGNVSNWPRTAVAPRKLGNYELGDRLGGGGMGDVYKARHLQFGRDRAVKVIKHHFVEAGNQEVIQRFYQEIKAVGALEHPNVVVAIDSSTPSDEVHYLVMEYIDGVSADELVERCGPLPVADACEIIRQAARGLAYIHQHSMVHRDIKPSNLMLTIVPTDDLISDTDQSVEPGGRQAVVKVLDLGLALLAADDQQRLTRFVDQPMGTAMYMSPEQWKTTRVDIRADIYSLGCTLYHLLSGKPPYWDSDLRPEKAHERETLRPIDGPYPLPPEVWNIVQKMTAKRPDDRYADPGEVAAALSPWTKGRRLVPLIEQAMGGDSDQVTNLKPRSDTLVARTGKSDTQAGQTPPNWKLPTPYVPASRRKLWQIGASLVVLLAVGAIGWLALQATGFRRSQQEAVLLRERALRFAADRAVDGILKEINTRYRIMTDLSANEALRTMMTEIDAAGRGEMTTAPANEALWQPLQEWLGARKAQFAAETPSDSWFITDRHGVQIARSPPSDKSLGKSYAFRDYFHGQGADLPEDATDVEPIDEPYQSSVYRSTSSNKLKVAFSVPIDNGKRGSAREVIGVLAMSVDLGEFDVLRRQLPTEYEVVLIDLRETTVDDQTRRGLILHHQIYEAFGRGEPPPWVGTELIAQIDQLLANGGAAERAVLLSNYRDLAVTDGRLFQGAVKPVQERRPDGDLHDTYWLVLVQEPMPK